MGIDAKLGATMFVTIGSILPQTLADMDANNGLLKRHKQRETHSLQEIVNEAQAEWFRYAEMFRNHGYDKPIPPYPYPCGLLKEMVAEGDKELQEVMERRAGKAA